MNKILWKPDEERIQKSAMYHLMESQGFSNYTDLHRWSVEHLEEFWQQIIRIGEVKFVKEPSSILDTKHDIKTASFFYDGKLSFTDHILRHRGAKPAIVFFGEDGRRQELSFDDLREAVSNIAAGLKEIGIAQGDRVVGFLPNCPEAIIAMLATTSLGAVWSSCSPDFGVGGVVDRFGQISPKVIFTADGYLYNGKYHDSLRIVKEIIKEIPSIDKTVIVTFIKRPSDISSIPGSMFWEELKISDSTLENLPQDFNHPLYIMYSSGTTGIPKCIIHGVGGTLVQHLKEHILHCDIESRDKVFFFTTCGWMMWNWLVTVLAIGATIYLYDGSPFAQKGKILWKIASEEKLTIFGAGAKFFSSTQKFGYKPNKDLDFNFLKTILSTGSVLAHETFDFLYEDVKKDVLVASISGGTDIISCFAGGNPILPVRRGELQCLALGMDVKIFNEDGVSIHQESGELVCCNPFPSMPVGFWDDDNNEKYYSAYFKKYSGVWAHGDYAEVTSENGLIIHGRSDAVLNPGGVRIGTAEIYRQVEKLEEILESIAIAQELESDTRIILFVVIKDGFELDINLKKIIKDMIRKNTTPRHVPEVILDVPDIPRTISGKIVELAVRNIVHGKAVKNIDALANPEALEYFKDIKELSIL